MIALYKKFSPSATFSCGLFTQSRGSQFFSYDSLKGKGNCTWSLIRDPLIVDQSKGYGLNMLRVAYGADRAINSGYRDPIHNKEVGGAQNSRHLFGDAADIRNEATAAVSSSESYKREWQQFIASGSATGLEDRCIQLAETPSSSLAKPCAEWLRMKSAALKAGAKYIEPLNLPCKLDCLHADWRGVPGDYR